MPSAEQTTRQPDSMETLSQRAAAKLQRHNMQPAKLQTTYQRRMQGELLLTLLKEVTDRQFEHAPGLREMLEGFLKG